MRMREQVATRLSPYPRPPSSAMRPMYPRAPFMIVLVVAVSPMFVLLSRNVLLSIPRSLPTHPCASLKEYTYDFSRPT